MTTLVAQVHQAASDRRELSEVLLLARLTFKSPYALCVLEVISGCVLDDVLLDDVND